MIKNSNRQLGNGDGFESDLYDFTCAKCNKVSVVEKYSCEQYEGDIRGYCKYCDDYHNGYFKKHRNAQLKFEF